MSATGLGKPSSLRFKLQNSFNVHESSVDHHGRSEHRAASFLVAQHFVLWKDKTSRQS